MYCNHCNNKSNKTITIDVATRHKQATVPCDFGSTLCVAPLGQLVFITGQYDGCSMRTAHRRRDHIHNTVSDSVRVL